MKADTVPPGPREPALPLSANQRQARPGMMAARMGDEAVTSYPQLGCGLTVLGLHGHAAGTHPRPVGKPGSIEQCGLSPLQLSHTAACFRSEKRAGEERWAPADPPTAGIGTRGAGLCQPSLCGWHQAAVPVRGESALRCP